MTDARSSHHSSRSFAARLRAAFRCTAALVLGAGALFTARPAAAYPWMIRHDYTACAQCHADPSGGGILTQYGRAQGEILLRTHYSSKPMEEPGAAGKFAFGVPLPDWMLLEAVSRTGMVDVTVPGAPKTKPIIYAMQDDFRGQITVWKFRLNGSIGGVDQGAQQAQVTSNQRHNVVSREHWLGFDATDSVLIRAGHMEIPYGIRDIVHDYYVRRQTRTDINQQQTDGLAVAYSGAKIRGELMGIAGNLQVKPDDFRDKGYAGYAEYTLFPKVTVGVSSLATHAKVDLLLRRELTRTSNGVFVRMSPWTPLVFEFEENGLVNEVDGKGPLRVGNCGVFVTDLEPIQGVHAVGAFEWFHDPMPSIGTSFGGWAGLQWFFAPHADARVDYVLNDVPAGINKRMRVTTLVYQFHFYL